jgi:ABC-type multidrug transport system ATPase subunit
VQKSNLQIGDKVVTIENGEFSWHKEAAQPTLEKINFCFGKGELVGILGRVGCGKTSLLSAIVGDMRRTEGEVTVSGSVSYAPQNPWCVCPVPSQLECISAHD